MLYIPKIADYLKILTDQEVKDFVLITFDECFESTREALYSKLSEKYLRKVLESFYTFLTKPDEVGKYVELIRKKEAQIMMQSSSPDDYVT